MEALEKRLVTIERLIRDILKERKVQKETWVKASTVMELTGWDREAMRRARRNNFVKVKKEKGSSIYYSLESIPTVFLKNVIE